jgi:hypothetical protein
MGASDTLRLTADSGYRWTRTLQGRTAPFLVNPHDSTDHRWKRLTSRSILWWEGGGRWQRARYLLTLDGPTLRLRAMQYQPEPDRAYLVLTRIAGPGSKP